MKNKLNAKKELLLNQLIASGFLNDRKVIEAFRKIPRENFIAKEFRKHAYIDEPLPIGMGQTISAPHIVAEMLHLLDLKEKDKVLEIGTGSGYNAALISKMVKGPVYSIEFYPELAEFARSNLQRSGISNVEVIAGDGNKGYKKAAPYDKIIVTCGSSIGIPKELSSQLKPGGIIVIPVGGPRLQELIFGRKVRGKIETEMHGSCVFVPMRN